MTLPDRTDRAKAIARTYGGDRDGWERVEEYQRAIEWRGAHPERGSGAASSALDLPRGRIRPWFDGAKPDPVHAVDTAEQNGWLDAQPGDRVFEGLVVLHAWVFGGGSITTESFAPFCAIGPDEPLHVARAAFDAVGVDCEVFHADDPDRATELRAAGPGQGHLGRFLHGVLGAPIGPKNARSDVTVPDWLGEAPFNTRLRWARTYVTLRATTISPRHGYVRQLAEDRSGSFRAALAGVFAGLIGDDDSVTAAEYAVLLRERSAAMLDVEPELPEE